MRGWPISADRRKAKAAPGLGALTVPEARRLLEIALPLPDRATRERLAWSLWRRAPCWQAQRSHDRHRSWPQHAGSTPFDTS